MKYLLLSILFLYSCSKVEPLPKDEEIVNLQQFMFSGSQYVKDQTEDLFVSQSWYTYDDPNHIIWPIFRVYSVRTKGEYYKLQIIDYYDGILPGYYTIRLAGEDKVSETWSFEATGCGNVYTNANYKECIKDPKQNVYTYLNLKERRQWKMPTKEAKKRKDWDIAFNGTEVKLNAGKEGPGDTRAASVFQYLNFFPNGNPDFQAIAEVSFGDKGIEFFELDHDIKNVPFALPKGIDRVVFEPDWFTQSSRNSSLNQAVSKNWWMLKGAEGNTFSKFSVSNIEETLLADESIETRITLKTYFQGAEDSTFGAEQTWELPLISSTQRLIKMCLDFDSQTVVDCSRDKDKWDIRLSISNRRGKRRWRMNVSVGAIGPINFEDMSSRTTGRGL